MSICTHFLQLAEPEHWLRPRAGETKLGQALTCLTAGDDYAAQVQALFAAGHKIAILGVPESIGPQANLGRGGAEGGWDAFQSQFYNLQYTPELLQQTALAKVLMVGAVKCDDLMAQVNGSESPRVEQLRALCAELDVRVEHALMPLFQAGYEVILIGGGHNNAYPLLRALHQATGQACGAVNLDPHADFRALEGRHSGNGFSYAHAEGALAFYHVVSLHEGKNSAQSLENLAHAGFQYDSMYQLYQRGFTTAMADIAAKAAAWQVPLGIELDLDAIQFAPASAYNTTGVQFSEAFGFVKTLAALPAARYLHLAEAAPSCHPAGIAAGIQHSGQLLSELVLAWLLARTATGS